MVRILATALVLTLVFGWLELAIGSVINAEQEFVCPDNALCFPEETEYFREEDLGSFLIRLGYTGREKFLCRDSASVGSSKFIVCGQQSVGGIPTYGFFLKVVFWSSNSDIRGIWCSCIREDVPLPTREISDDQFDVSVSNFVRGHLLVRDGGNLLIDQPRLALLRHHELSDAFQLALHGDVTFTTSENVSAEFAMSVDAANGRVLKADDLKKSTSRKGFLMDPWDDLGRRLAASPKDAALFREYQEYGAFRSRGKVEAEFQADHRNSLQRFDPEGESTFGVIFSDAFSAGQVLALFESYDLFVYELHYVFGKEGQIYNKSIEDLETSDGNMDEIIEYRLLDQLRSPQDWYLPALSSVPSTNVSSRSLEDVRFRSARVQMNHTEALQFWRNERDHLIALIPYRSLNARMPPSIDELRTSLE